MTIHEPLVLGPQFADLADCTEESILGSSAHQDAIVVLHNWLDACGRGRGPRGYEPWEPEDDGRWHSASGIAFAPQSSLLRVFDQDGNLVPTGPELREYNRRLRDRLAAQDRQIAESDRRIAALEAELRRLRGE